MSDSIDQAGLPQLPYGLSLDVEWRNCTGLSEGLSAKREEAGLFWVMEQYGTLMEESGGRQG